MPKRSHGKLARFEWNESRYRWPSWSYTVRTTWNTAMQFLNLNAQILIYQPLFVSFFLSLSTFSFAFGLKGPAFVQTEPWASVSQFVSASMHIKEFIKVTFAADAARASRSSAREAHRIHPRRCHRNTANSQTEAEADNVGGQNHGWDSPIRTVKD